MKHGEKLLVGVAGSLAICLTAQALTANSSATPYQTIPVRNVFGLRPAPPPPTDTPPTPPPSKVFLTGITTIFGNKRALMKAAGKPGDKKGDQYFILTEGEREGDVEVISIDEKKGNVKIKNCGVELTLNIDKDGPAAPAGGGAPGPFPGGVPPPTGIIPHPVAGVPNTYAPPMANSGFSLPQRIPRTPNSGNQGVTPMAGGYGAPMPNVSAGGIALPGFNSVPTAQSATQPPVQQFSSLEEQVLNMEVQREQAKKNGDPVSFLIPPTPLTPSSGDNTAASAPSTTRTSSGSPPLPPGFPPLPGRGL